MLILAFAKNTQNMSRLLIYTLLLAAIIACQNAEKPPANEENGVTPTPPENEDEVLLRLSSDLYLDPQTQDERDQNAIVNYAIDNSLDVQSTPSGLYYQIIEAGTGDTLQWGDRVRVHYRGYFLNGKEFDSSYKRDKPIEFYIGNMIHGWNEALEMMQPGAKALLLVPSRLGYGEKGLKDGNGSVLVPPNEPLIFEMEVLNKL